MRKILISTLFLILNLLGNAQDVSTVDSLENVLKNAQDKIVKSTVLQELSIEYFNNSPQKALKTAHLSKSYAIASADKNTISNSFFNIAVIQYKTDEYDSAMYYYKKADKYCNENVLRSKIYDNIGDLYRDLSLYDSSLIVLNKSLHLKETLGDRSSVANSYNSIGNVYLRMLKYDEALSNYKLSLEIRKAENDEEAIAALLNNIGTVYKKLGQYDNALSTLKEALEIQEKSGDKKRIAYTLHNIGNFYFQLKTYDKAQEYYSKGLELRMAIGDKNDIAASRFNMATVHRDLGNFDEALKYYSMSLELRQEVGNKKAVALTLTAIAGLYNNQKKHMQAIHFYKQALQMQQEIGSRQHIASTFEKLGVAYKDTSMFNAATENYLKAQKIYSTLDNKVGQARIENYIGNILREQHKYSEALNHYNSANETYSLIENKQGKAYTIFNIAELYNNKLEIDSAIVYYKEAQNIAENIDEKLLVKKCSFALYTLYKQLSDLENSLFYFEKYNAVKDSLLQDRNIQRIAEIEFEANIELLEQRNENQALKLREEEAKRLQVRLYLIIAIIVAILILGFSITLYKQFSQKKRAFDLLTQSRKELETAYHELEEIHELLREKNEKLTDSISYAKRIQKTILPSDELISESFPKHFVYYRPKEIVSGDFYWFAENGNYKYIAAIDCTGHGIPGAFMSMVGNTLLNEIVNEFGIYEPADILNKLDAEVIKTLKQNKEDSKQEDGMELSLLRYNTLDNTLVFAGAGHKLVICNNGEIESISTSQFSIGGMHSIKVDKNIRFNQVEVDLKKGMRLFMYSDGYIDQFGGEKDTKFGSPRFFKLLGETHNIDIAEQHTAISRTFDEWKGEGQQIDDVVVIGIEF